MAILSVYAGFMLAINTSRSSWSFSFAALIISSELQTTLIIFLLCFQFPALFPNYILIVPRW